MSTLALNPIRFSSKLSQKPNKGNPDGLQQTSSLSRVDQLTQENPTQRLSTEIPVSMFSGKHLDSVDNQLSKKYNGFRLFLNSLNEFIDPQSQINMAQLKEGYTEQMSRKIDVLFHDLAAQGLVKIETNPENGAVQDATVTLIGQQYLDRLKNTYETLPLQQSIQQLQVRASYLASTGAYAAFATVVGTIATLAGVFDGLPTNTKGNIAKFFCASVCLFMGSAYAADVLNYVRDKKNQKKDNNTNQNLPSTKG